VAAEKQSQFGAAGADARGRGAPGTRRTAICEAGSRPEEFSVRPVGLGASAGHGSFAARSLHSGLRPPVEMTREGRRPPVKMTPGERMNWPESVRESVPHLDAATTRAGSSSRRRTSSWRGCRFGSRARRTCGSTGHRGLARPETADRLLSRDWPSVLQRQAKHSVAAGVRRQPCLIARPWSSRNRRGPRRAGRRPFPPEAEPSRVRAAFARRL
jgi:hypothetical protein